MVKYKIDRVSSALKNKETYKRKYGQITRRKKRTKEKTFKKC